MMWFRIVLLAGLTSSVSGMFDVKTTSYQAEEGGSVTFGWDGHTRPSPEGVPLAPEELQKEVTSHWTIVRMGFGYLSIGLVVSVFLLLTVACLFYQADQLKHLHRQPLIVANV